MCYVYFIMKFLWKTYWLSVLISPTQQFVFQGCNFFLGGRWVVLPSCLSFIRLSTFYLATEIISVRLEQKFFRHHLMVSLCDSYCHLLTYFGFVCFFYSTSGTFLIKEMKNKTFGPHLPRIKLWKKPEIKNFFFQQQQNKQPHRYNSRRETPCYKRISSQG